MTVCVRMWEKTPWGEWRRALRLTSLAQIPTREFASWQAAYAYVRKQYVQHEGRVYHGQDVVATCTKFEMHDMLGVSRGASPLWMLDVLGKFKQQDRKDAP
jgi:hypothetical protein